MNIDEQIKTQKKHIQALMTAEDLMDAEQIYDLDNEKLEYMKNDLVGRKNYKITTPKLRAPHQKN